MRATHSTPEAAVGTMKALRPLAPSPSPVRAKTTARSAMGALEIHVFSPSRTHSSPSRRAVVASAATSEPASASLSANAAMVSPEATPGSQSRLWRSVPTSEIGPLPSPCMAKAKSARAER